MKTAIIYFSLEGNTKHIAENVAKKLGSENADLIELKPVNAFPTGKVSKYFWGGKSATFNEKPELEKYDFNAENYDVVVIGSPLWAWKITPPIRTFLSENDLSHKKVAAFISCGGGDPQKAFDFIKTETKHENLVAEMTVINPLQNQEKTDRKIEKFCEEIKEEIKKPAP